METTIKTEQPDPTFIGKEKVTDENGKIFLVVTWSNGVFRYPCDKLGRVIGNRAGNQRQAWARGRRR